MATDAEWAPTNQNKNKTLPNEKQDAIRAPMPIQMPIGHQWQNTKKPSENLHVKSVHLKKFCGKTCRQRFWKNFE